ncbi:serum paraoxonase/arylesterase 1-like, partial [Ylistrum balloti]|uniref:serum paraoxonase/arylesterase 1-like n=1 Tax=Ylistrum balloti TaxID=509963 RepID=UPI0029058010
MAQGYYPDKRGRILMLDMNDPSPTVTEAQITGASLDRDNFNPHGLSSWTNPHTREITLMVINHFPGQERVEVFRYNRKSRSLEHKKSVTNQLRGILNDLVMTGEDTFYVTMIAYFNHPLLTWLEESLLLSLGEILFYDGVGIRSVAGGLHMPNGINTSPDG